MGFLVEKNLAKKVELQPKIQNVVVTADFEESLNLETFSENVRAIYEPEQFPGLVYKLSEPNATFLLFTNGKLVCTGTKNKEQLEESMDQLLRNIKVALKNYEK